MPHPQRRAAVTTAREALDDIPVQLAALRAMTTGELRTKYLEVFGEPSRSKNKDHLRKKIAWKIQADAEGGLSRRALLKIKELGTDAPIRVRPTRAQRATAATVFASETAPPPEPKPRDPRLPPPGTTLRREYRGVIHEIIVHGDDFEYRGKRHPSLSRIAREITGTQWNGLLFFGLVNRKRGEVP